MVYRNDIDFELIKSLFLKIGSENGQKLRNQRCDDRKVTYGHYRFNLRRLTYAGQRRRMYNHIFLKG